MPDSIPDLIPDVFDTSAEESPLEILQAQGEHLAEKTRGVVRGEVEPGASGSGWAGWGFNLYAPTLGYRYQPLEIRYPILGKYPVTLSGALVGEDKEVRASSRDEFVERLRAVFGSPAFSRVVASIMREAAAVGTQAE